MDRVHVSLLFLADPQPAEGALGKAPLAPSCCLSLHPPFPCPHTGGTHMWPPVRSSLVSIPSFSISICRKVLTFCRVSSSEYLQGCREGDGCSLPACVLPCPSPSPVKRALSSLGWSVQARLSTLRKLKACPLCTKADNQPTKQTPARQTNKRKEDLFP